MHTDYSAHTLTIAGNRSQRSGRSGKYVGTFALVTSAILADPPILIILLCVAVAASQGRCGGRVVRRQRW
jgi:hypothetical protein